ncbi:MAG: PadR family transcriptional regulator [Candidatus Aenigmarchaeota archaeon]|nr:PadR family transcriptional regulator [Candidatus Aenigmarchaeota archaeon]
MVLERHKKFAFLLSFMNTQRSIQKHPIILSTQNCEEISRYYRKKLVRSCKDLLILYLLEHYGSLHGYNIMKNLREKFGYNPGASTVYPTLWSLEEKGFIESQIVKSEKPRRVYSITQTGKLHFQAKLNELKLLVRGMNVESSIQNWYRRYLKTKL